MSQKPWYQTKRWIATVGIGVAVGVGLARRDGEPEEVNRFTASTAPPPARAAPTLSDADVPDESLRDVLCRYASERYASGRYKLKRCAVSASIPRQAIVEVDLLGEEGLTASLMRHGAVREVMELLKTLSASSATTGVHLYQVTVYLPGQDKYGQPTEAMGVAVTLKSSEARRINWASMTADRFLELARDVGTVLMHPSLR